MDRFDLPSSVTPDPQAAALCFGRFRLEPDGTLFKGNSVIHLAPRELAALRLLLERAGEVVAISEMKRALWGAGDVTAESLPRCISSLRARLEPEDPIQTVYKRGYRLTADVSKAVAAIDSAPRLAVAPFASDQGAPSHLGAAIAEETIARLSNTRMAVVKVLARDSCFALAKRGKSPVELGAALKADLVLTGAIRTLASCFRLRVEMVRVSDGTQIWVEDMLVDRQRGTGLEAELVDRLVFRLSLAGSEEWPESRSAPRRPAGEAAQPAHGKPHQEPVRNYREGGQGLSISASAAEAPVRTAFNQEAYEVFLRGRHEWQTMERHRMQDGLQKLTRAAELDPTLIAAKVELANLCVTQEFYGYMAPATAANLVHSTADMIPDLPKTAPAMLPAIGWMNFHYDRNLPAALWAFAAAEGLPYEPWTTRVRAMFALSRRRFGQTIALLKSALEIDPFSPWLSSRLALAYHLDGQAAASIAQIKQAMSLFPGHEGSNIYGAIILAHNGEAGKAVDLAADLARRLPFFDMAASVHAYTLACAGRAPEARSILERLNWLGKERYVLRTMNAAALVALGDLEAAIAELRWSADARCPWFFQSLADPRLKPLRNHPGFVEMEAVLPRMEAAVGELMHESE